MSSLPISPQSINIMPIMIIEDNEVNRASIEKTLQSRGLNNLLSFSNADEALKQMERVHPDLIILDIMMPGMDGFEYSRVLRQKPEYQDVPILVQTAITEPELRFKAFEMGATDFISKPIYPDELYARVKVHLQNRLYLKGLRQYKERIADELTSAQRLQYSILPTDKEVSDIELMHQIEMASYFKPCSEIGGDFWGTKALFPHQAAVWMVDFSGHGVPSALNAFRLQAYLKEHSQFEAKPGDYLSHLNEKLLHLLLRGHFATMFYGIVDTISNNLLYACSATPHPVILKSATGKASLIDGSGHPLGISLRTYRTQSVSFCPGDVLLLYSDALTETPDATGAGLTEDMLIHFLEEHGHKNATTICTQLLELFNKHSSGVIGDDLTIVVCKRKNS